MPGYNHHYTNWLQLVTLGTRLGRQRQWSAALCILWQPLGLNLKRILDQNPWGLGIEGHLTWHISHHISGQFLGSESDDAISGPKKRAFKSISLPSMQPLGDGNTKNEGSKRHQHIVPTWCPIRCIYSLRHSADHPACCPFTGCSEQKVFV